VDDALIPSSDVISSYETGSLRRPGCCWVSIQLGDPSLDAVGLLVRAMMWLWIGVCSMSRKHEAWQESIDSKNTLHLFNSQWYNGRFITWFSSIVIQRVFALICLTLLRLAIRTTRVIMGRNLCHIIDRDDINALLDLANPQRLWNFINLESAKSRWMSYLQSIGGPIRKYEWTDVV